jgi:uncharacterized protein YkvS
LIYKNILEDRQTLTMLNDIFADIFTNNGWISGSYVREKIIRKDVNSLISDIDILIPFRNFNLLKKTLIEKYSAKYEIIDYNKKDLIAHFHFIIGDYMLDVFSCQDHCYLSPPDVDVNTICWNGSNFVSWFLTDDVINESQELYSALFDINSVIDRCKKKDAIALTKEWDFMGKEFNDEIKGRVNKLVRNGWNILNRY